MSTTIKQENWDQAVDTAVMDITGWSTSAAFPTDLGNIKVIAGGMVKGLASNGVLAFFDATSSDCYIEGTMPYTAASGVTSAGLAVRCIDSDNFIAIRSYGVSNMEIYWRDNNNTDARIEIVSYSHTPETVYRLQVEADILTLYADGVKISSDVDVSGKLSGSGVGFFTRNVNPAVGTLTIESLSDSVISITPHPARKIFPVFGSTYTHTVEGTYSGSIVPTTVECKVEEFVSGNTVVDWALLDASPSAGTYTGTVDVPKGKYYRIRTRFSNSVGIATETSRIGFGLVYLGDGQSNMVALFSGGDATATDDLAIFESSSWLLPTNERIVDTLKAISAANNCVVGICSTAVSASSIAQHLVGGSNYSARQAMLTAIGGKANGMLWDQGEGDSSSLSYLADLGTLYTDILTRTGQTSATLPMFIVQLGRNEGSSGNDAGWQRVRSAQTQFAGDTANVYIGSQKLDLPMADGLHFTPEGYKSTALRLGDSVNFAIFGTGNSGRGVIPTGATVNGSTLTINHDLNGSTSITLPANSKDGYEVSDDDFSTLIAITSISTSGSTIVMELERSVTEVKVRSQQGQDPDHAKFPLSSITYAGASVMVEPIVNSFTSTVGGGVVVPDSSTLNLTATGIPDGSHSSEVWDASQNPMVRLSVVNITFSSDTATINVAKVPGTVIKTIIDGTNPPVTGVLCYGVTS